MERKLRYIIEFDDSGATPKIQRLERNINEIGLTGAVAGKTAATGLSKIGLAMVGSVTAGVTLGSAITGILRGVTQMVPQIARASEELSNFAIRTGMSVREADAFRAAAQIMGVNADTLEIGMRQLSVGLATATSEGKRAKDALRALGIQFLDFRTGEIKPTIPLLIEISRALANVESPTERLRYATALLGRGATEMLPVLLRLNAAMREAGELKLFPSEDAIARLQKYDDALDKLNLRWMALKRQLAAGIVGAIDIVIAQRQLAPGTAIDRAAAARGVVPFGRPYPALEPPAPPPARVDLVTQQITADVRARVEGLKLIQAALQKGATDAESMRRQLSEVDDKIRELRMQLENWAQAGGVPAAVSAATRQALDEQLALRASILARIKAATEAEEAYAKAVERGKQLVASLDALQRERRERQKQDVIRFIEDELEHTLRANRELARAREEFNRETLDAMQAVYEARAALEAAALDRWRAAELAALSQVAAETVAQKQALEQRKLEIETEYLKRSLELRLEAINRQKIAELERVRAAADAARVSEEDLQRRLAQVRDAAESRRQEAIIRTNTEIQEHQTATANRSASIIEDHNRRVFDSLKHSAEGVFDAMLRDSTNMFRAMANALKLAILTAIKEILSSQVAAMLMTLFGSGPGRLSGRPGVIGAVTGGIGTQVPAGRLAGLGIGGFPLGGWREFFGLGPSIQIGPGAATTWAAATWTQRLASIARSPAAFLTAIGLGMGGLMRGDTAGALMTTAAGALVGFKYGGGLGALIGAVAGGITGLIRKFIGSAEDKARKKIREAYQVEITDKNVLRQIVQIAKQDFGGDIHRAILSAPVRDLIELYALSTGQSAIGLPRAMRPVSIVQAAGALLTQPEVQVGAGITGIGRALPAQPIVINVNVPGAKEFFENETVRVVVDNPRAVQTATLSATRANAGRRELLALQLSPGTLLA